VNAAVTAAAIAGCAVIGTAVDNGMSYDTVPAVEGAGARFSTTAAATTAVEQRIAVSFGRG